MAVFKLFPEKDASIYSLYPYTNTGLDEIVEVSSQLNELINTGNSNNVEYAEASRILIQFSSASIKDIIDNKISGSTYKVYLRLFLAEADSTPAAFNIIASPISGVWDMGTGRYSDIPATTDGVSWYYNTATSLWPTSSFNSGTTGSFSGSKGGGGVWYTSSNASQSFAYSSSNDILMDVTSMVTLFYSHSSGITGGIPNNGFLLRQANEFLTSSVFNYKFFSMDTHTIYPPQLEFRWNDNVYNTGSGIVVSTNQYVASLADNKNRYQKDSVQKFRINVRDKYPTRQFITSSVYLNARFLPSQSYWAIKDVYTDETVVDFDTNFTTINADGTSSYFTVYMTGLEPERNYRFVFKSIIGSETIIQDSNYYFKVSP